MITNSKGYIQYILLGIAAVAVVVLGYFYLTQKSIQLPIQYSTTQSPSTESAAVINNSKGLDNASTSVDSLDSASLDAEMNKLDADASSF